MASKVRMFKLLQEIRGFAEIAIRHPAARSPGLFLAQIRSQGIHESLRRRRLNITIGDPDHSEIPHRVKINHVKQRPDTTVRLPAA